MTGKKSLHFNNSQQNAIGTSTLDNQRRQSLQTLIPALRHTRKISRCIRSSSRHLCNQRNLGAISNRSERHRIQDHEHRSPVTIKRSGLGVHLFSGLRHFVLDMGAGYELKNNKMWSIATFILSLLTTGFVWLYIFGKAL